MTVGELIEILSKLDPNKEIGQTGYFELDPIEGVRSVDDVPGDKRNGQTYYIV